MSKFKYMLAFGLFDSTGRKCWPLRSHSGHFFFVFLLRVKKSYLEVFVFFQQKLHYF